VYKGILIEGGKISKVDHVLTSSDQLLLILIFLLNNLT